MINQQKRRLKFLHEESFKMDTEVRGNSVSFLGDLNLPNIKRFFK